MFSKIITLAVLSISVAMTSIAPVLASGGYYGSYTPTPAPGVLGLVAIGIIGAAIVARRRK